jgi:hypothetical protein
MAAVVGFQDNEAAHSLPPFANAENKELSGKVRSLDAHPQLLIQNGSRSNQWRLD